MPMNFFVCFDVLYKVMLISGIIFGTPCTYIYRVRRENFDTAHRRVDGIKMNMKVPYSLAIFAIIIEILIFKIVLMRARREKRSSRSRYNPA